MEKKEFDAVAMTRRIREGHAEQLKNASVEERVAFYREKARELHEQLSNERAQPVQQASTGNGTRVILKP